MRRKPSIPPQAKEEATARERVAAFVSSDDEGDDSGGGSPIIKPKR
jgi:hypothetical protein